jgi:two-component system OmpR family sensor kinase
VEAHGGEVAVRSVPGDTVFTVSLPLAPADAGADLRPSANLA